MKHFSLRFTVALLTFLICVSVTVVWLYRRSPSPTHVELLKVTQPTISSTLTDPCSFTRTEKKILEGSEAIQLAECFIIQNGYTDLPPITDKSKWSPDSVWGKPDEGAMKARRNTLKPQAYGIAKGKTEDRYAWMVVFQFNLDNEIYRQAGHEYDEVLKKAGYVVTMDEYGDKIRMEHSPRYLESEGVKKLVP